QRLASYGSLHSLHAAAVCGFLSGRLGWSVDRRASLVGAALTMNLAMIELQGKLAVRGGPLTPELRKEVHAHPAESAALLRQAGIMDADWLAAVEQHHERPDGKGYPHGLPKSCEMAQILRLVDIFTAKHSVRSGRPALPARQAAQELYVQSEGAAVAALLIKELGIFPPGCFVKLASGETAIVVRRGSSANAPIASVIANRNGDAVSTPIRRDTSNPEFAVQATLPGTSVLVKVAPEQLYDASES
ncbi:MAG TPA: HD domain-containing phosphohydrolase, partial [Croceibacterium sp.]|nr:HD domain-containing phosphohydrolase [Croceibacterium sp.]